MPWAHCIQVECVRLTKSGVNGTGRLAASSRRESRPDDPGAFARMQPGFDSARGLVFDST
jgi:hypothetical protein